MSAGARLEALIVDLVGQHRHDPARPSHRGQERGMLRRLLGIVSRNGNRRLELRVHVCRSAARAHDRAQLAPAGGSCVSRNSRIRSSARERLCREFA